MIYVFFNVILFQFFFLQFINYGFRVLFFLNRVEIKFTKLFHLQKQIIIKLYKKIYVQFGGKWIIKF